MGPLHQSAQRVGMGNNPAASRQRGSQETTRQTLQLRGCPDRRQASPSLADCAVWRHAAGMAAEGLREALADYQRAQHELVEARNCLAQAIAGAARSGMTRDEIVELTGYPADLVLRICTDASVSATGGRTVKG
jgi:hypothetical protein